MTSPPITITPPAVALALVDLADCVCSELATTGAGPTCWCGLYPGSAVSWEYCAECSGGTCGMGYVRLAGVFPYDTFPVPDVDERCAKPIAWTLEVGALRCMPQPPSGELLDATAMMEVAVAQILDGGALYRAIKCCGLTVAVGQWSPLGPQGGCVGGAWQAWLALDAFNVKVKVTHAAIIRALNTPGGAVHEWRDQIGREVLHVAEATAPINDPLNAVHRGMVVGTYAASFGGDRRGSSGHHVIARVYNTAEHAGIVEEGRPMVIAKQRFSWTEWGGNIHVVPSTQHRAGQHILARALVAVMGSQGLIA